MTGKMADPGARKDPHQQPPRGWGPLSYSCKELDLSQQDRAQDRFPQGVQEPARPEPDVPVVIPVWRAATGQGTHASVRPLDAGLLGQRESLSPLTPLCSQPFPLRWQCGG